ncbi:MAG: diphosphomevalonate decarboxylase [Anaerolineales bacterium]|nr:diphosphomevalonate decarboxylase [Chloroflexota bacterium]MBL6980326.1 diphosphomevalonate decarboxylase [Anaerolineales bacterium]
MNSKTATAVAHPNIAFIKYWGNHNQELRIPSNGSISMNLGALFTRTSVTFDESLQTDQLTLQGESNTGPALQRVSGFLDIVRKTSSLDSFARVESQNNFPMGTGIASSASAFAALSLAASVAAGLDLEEKDLSRLARRGSGSACRSVPGGFVEWAKGSTDVDSYAISFASPEHWDLADCVAIVSQAHKATGSNEGHRIANTSPLQAMRIEQIPSHLKRCRDAILQRDFEVFAEITEHDCNMMHAVMMTSNPSLIYWLPPTLAIMQAVREWRKSGIPVCYTIDAGPNVHVICEAAYQENIVSLLNEIPGVERVMRSGPGGPARPI